jgi:undecaprenyl-diphosphatase
VNVSTRESDRRVNTDLLRTVNGWSGNAVLDGVMRLAAEQLIFASFAVVAVLCGLQVVRRQVAPVALVAAALALAFVAGRTAAVLFPEPRPFTTHPDLNQLLAHEPGQSFPSDHSLAAFACGFAVLAFLSRRWGALLLVAATLIGFSRVYGGVHYPLDILGAALIGGLAVLALSVARTHAHLPALVRPRTGTPA